MTTAGDKQGILQVVNMLKEISRVTRLVVFSFYEFSIILLINNAHGGNLVTTSKTFSRVFFYSERGNLVTNSISFSREFFLIQIKPTFIYTNRGNHYESR